MSLDGDHILSSLFQSINREDVDEAARWHLNKSLPQLTQQRFLHWPHIWAWYQTGLYFSAFLLHQVTPWWHMPSQTLAALQYSGFMLFGRAFLCLFACSQFFYFLCLLCTTRSRKLFNTSSSGHWFNHFNCQTHPKLFLDGGSRYNVHSFTHIHWAPNKLFCPLFSTETVGTLLKFYMTCIEIDISKPYAKKRLMLQQQLVLWIPKSYFGFNIFHSLSIQLTKYHR